ncbi:MAG TPA: glycosyltransferase family 2 protein [Flavisolibacter sp.]|nr:glycosyltransferase family 2 protein [Flavisolibacter sp.]
MLNIIIPIAGTSELFEKAGYIYPKPLIEINGKLMIEMVLENLLPVKTEKKFTFIIREEDCVNFHLDNTLRLLIPDANVSTIKRPTQGALCSVLMSIDHIQPDDELLIVNGDQLIDQNLDKVIAAFHKEDAEAGLLTFSSVHPRWSYARTDENNQVLETAEKNPISKNAIAGFYYFKNASDFIEAATHVLLKDTRINDLFFISSTVNEYVLMNRKVLNFSIGGHQYHSFYSPQMINEYESTVKK